MTCLGYEFDKKYVEKSNNLSCLLNSYFSLPTIILYTSMIHTILSKLGKASFPFKRDKPHSEYFKHNELNNPLQAHFNVKCPIISK